MFDSPKPPPMETPPPPAPPEVDAEELARQRASLNERRRGRKSLRIESNAVAAPGSGGNGLSIPKG